MEFAFRSRQTMAAADDVETGRRRRFHDDLPPPPYGDANASQVDAALARRREELLWELDKARIRQDTIFRELVLTEHAMGITAGGHNPVPALPSSQDYWHHRPSPSPVPPLEDLPLHPQRSSIERSPCGCRGPAPAREPPVYPYVEWSPPRAASDTEKQQDSRSSGARTHPFDGHVELCPSLKKQTPVDEASLPAAVNAGFRATLHEEVTPGHKDAACGERKSDVVNGHDVNLLSKSGNQNNGQRTTAETTPVDQIKRLMLQSGNYNLAGPESAAFDRQKGRASSEPKPVQPQLGNGDEQKASVHAFNSYMELRLTPSRGAPVEETLVPVAAKAGISPVQSAPSFGKETATGQQQAFGEPKDGHGMEPSGDMRNQSNGQRKAMEYSMEGQTDKPAGPPGQHRSAGQENAAYNEQKKVEFSESKPVQPQLGSGDEQKARVHAFNGYMELHLSASKRAPVEQTLVPAAAKADISPIQSAPSFGKEMATGQQQPFGEPKANVEDGHGMQPLGEIRNQSSGQRKAMESSMEGQTDKPTPPPGQHRPAGQENAAHNEQKKVEFSESTPERTSYGLKRKLEDSGPLSKKQKPHWQPSCFTCNVTMPSQRHLEEHLAGRRHRLRVEELQSSRIDTAEPSTKAKPVWDRIAAKNTESSLGDGNGNLSENRWPQQQRGTPGAGHKSFNHHADAKKADRKDELYCKICDVQCNSEKMLASHLGGRRHRERLEESD
ncbi:unnamed protein product [Urochloa humidicola]